MPKPLNDKDLGDVIAECRRGYTLPQPFYSNRSVFQADRANVLDDLWHIAGHASQIPRVGDFFLYRICGEEIIVVRDKTGSVRAHYNVCRHRGSRICRESTGNVKALVCPYHAWTYRLDGSLRAARLMPEDFRPDDYSLHACHVSVVGGIIFVSLANDPAAIETVTDPYRPYLEFHGIGDAKVARKINLPTAANWKLVVENFIECYHCTPSHPEYSSVHSKLKLLAAGAGKGSGPEAACRQYQVELAAWEKKVAALGHPYLEGDYPDGAGMARMPIKEGWLTESQDGQPVAPLMGKCKEYDGGITSIAFNYLNYLLASNDHAVVFRFTPISELSTDVEAIWLVDGGAVEGTDYDPAKVSWVWDVTLGQDATITEANQAGVLSSKYQPGPYSDQERMNREFADWYIGKLSP